MSTEDRQAAEHNRAIEKSLKEDAFHAGKDIKLLLLGSNSVILHSRYGNFITYYVISF